MSNTFARIALLAVAAGLPAFSAAETRELRVYHASFLRHGPNAAKVSPEVRSKLFAEHIAYRRSLYERGDLLMYGPLDVGPESPMRGLSVFRGDKSIDEVRKLVAQDPYVKAGVMESDVVVWLSEVPRVDRGFGIRKVEVP
jgi:uncharacterized protein YciI